MFLDIDPCARVVYSLDLNAVSPNFPMGRSVLLGTKRVSKIMPMCASAH